MGGLSPVYLDMALWFRVDCDLHFETDLLELVDYFSFTFNGLLEEIITVLNIKANMAVGRELKWDIFLWLVLPLCHVLGFDVLANELVLSPVKEDNAGSFSHKINFNKVPYL